MSGTADSSSSAPVLRGDFRLEGYSALFQALCDLGKHGLQLVKALYDPSMNKASVEALSERNGHMKMDMDFEENPTSQQSHYLITIKLSFFGSIPGGVGAEWIDMKISAASPEEIQQKICSPDGDFQKMLVENGAMRVRA